MIVQSNYYGLWQQNRINFMLSKYTKDFFKGKRILELGPFNGYIGAYFAELGAIVHCLEGRQENVQNIQATYPNITVELANLDTPDWKWGTWDIIINYGLYYHLQNYHTEHLENCIKNCDLMFFESVIYDSFESEIYFINESGNDQSLSDMGGTPSTSYVENIFKKNNINYTKYIDSQFNDGLHHYDWHDSNKKILDRFARRFWILEKINKN